jgi:hypothetical protein
MEEGMRWSIFCCATALCATALAQEIPYRIGTWDADSLGNHRVVIYVESNQTRDAVRVHIPWRRRDKDPESKRIVIVDAATGKEIRNVLRVSVSREEGDLVFQPLTVPGEYHVYYLPTVGTKRSNYPRITYPRPDSTAQQEWLWRNYLTPQDLKLKSWTVLPRAEVVAFEAIDSLNNFWPMEVIATEKEIASLAAASPAAYLVFPEDRRHSIVMTEDLPYRWILRGPGGVFADTVSRGEFCSFQLGIFALRRRLDSLAITFPELRNETGGGTIPAVLFSALSLGGIDHDGREFRKSVGIDSGRVHPLWCGVQVPGDLSPGTYTGTVIVAPGGSDPTEIPFRLTVRNETIAAAGDDDPTRLSRLRWLNSRLAADDSLIAPYTPVLVRGTTLSILGRRVTLGGNGLPRSIESLFTEEMTSIGTTPRRILVAPIGISVEDSAGRSFPYLGSGVEFTTLLPGIARWSSRGDGGPLEFSVNGSLEGDGTMEYSVAVRAVSPCSLANIRMRLPFSSATAHLMMGLGRRGGFRPQSLSWHWDVTRNQDGAWIGDVNAGLQFLLKDENYSRPLNTNFYQLKPLVMPVSWANGGRGGIEIGPEEGDTLSVVCYSGGRRMAQDEVLHFNFRLTVTPFHPLDTKGQWSTRYYHRFDSLRTIAQTGANTVNVHHATPINPYINYPFLRPAAMKEYADSAHALGMKMKIYYTVRELTNRAPELQALRSLGDEVFAHGPGGGYSWLQEHLATDYIAAWFVPELKDAAIVNSGVSRWHNYYVEGLAWLVRNVGIDGLYLDDVAFDRTTMKRIRKVLDRGRGRGALIDLHSANQYNERDGFANSANLYLEHLPYINRLWFGEYFDYDAPPDHWMVEMSGIPFGLMGEMLEKGGNPWRGVLFGMTNRLPWAGDPRPVWKAWDEFGIQESRMIGYWASTVPVRTDRDSVPATVYLRKGRALVALASWGKGTQRVRLTFDWKTLGMNPRKVHLFAPAVEGFQDSTEFATDIEIPVEQGKGWMLILESTN